jgi:hypothetical protein
MDKVAHTQSNDGMLKNAAAVEERVGDARAGESSVAARERDGEETRARRRPWAGKKRKSYSHAHFKVYKRRWFGLAQLVLLNVVVSWDVRLPPFHLPFIIPLQLPSSPSEQDRERCANRQTTFQHL